MPPLTAYSATNLEFNPTIRQQGQLSRVLVEVCDTSSVAPAASSKGLAPRLHNDLHVPREEIAGVSWHPKRRSKRYSLVLLHVLKSELKYFSTWTAGELATLAQMHKPGKPCRFLS